jgi:hypothetical protein
MRTRIFKVIAQDPSVMSNGKILRSELSIPWEDLEPGPKGSRVHVIDFDATSGYLITPVEMCGDIDPFEEATDDELLNNPHFHALNTYVIAMSILGKFEQALGRRVGWGFEGSHLKITPHAFADANAYYSRHNEALLFGYISGKKPIYTSLSYDIITHEVTHALLDALRPNYMRPSSADQMAFHEGFADIIAILSVLSQQSVIEHALTVRKGANRDSPFLSAQMIPVDNLTEDALKDSILFGVAEEFGEKVSIHKARGDVLRRSIKLPPSPKYLNKASYQEPHTRGEILVAAIMNAFLRIWLKRIDELKKDRKKVDSKRVAEEGKNAATHLCTMVIRALDYVPPIDLCFEEYLIGLLTADAELYPNDQYHYREEIEKCFLEYGIDVQSKAVNQALLSGNQWKKEVDDLDYSKVHFRALQWDKCEAWRFIWDNRSDLFTKNELSFTPFTIVESVRPLVRLSVDGFTVRETIIEYIQLIEIRANELPKIGIIKPESLIEESLPITVKGGGLIILDEYGRVKYHIRSDISDSKKQEHLLSFGWDRADRDGEKMLDADNVTMRFASLHRNRMSW